MSENKKTFWPYGILLALLAIIIACIITIVFASNYPVYEDDFYFDSYQNVENNYNKIQIAQENFNKLYNVYLDLNSTQDKRKRRIYTLDSNASKVRFIVSDVIEDDEYPNFIKVDLLLTRPHTNAQNIKLQAQALKPDPKTKTNKSFHRYFLDATLPSLEKGRWQLKMKIEHKKNPGWYPNDNNESTIGFFSYELNVQ